MSSAGLEEMEKQMPRTAGKPVVSIGMPVYNAERYLARAVDSLLKQDYPDLELIISDNASTDGTWKLCQEYAERDRRVRELLEAAVRVLGVDHTTPGTGDSADG